MFKFIRKKKEEEKKKKERKERVAWATAYFGKPPKDLDKLDNLDIKKYTPWTDERIYRYLVIISESLNIILKTKNEDTRNSRIKLVKDRYTDILALKPFASEKANEEVLRIEDLLRETGML